MGMDLRSLIIFKNFVCKRLGGPLSLHVMAVFVFHFKLFHKTNLNGISIADNIMIPRKNTPPCAS